jgi:hypothetical protein
MMKVHQIFRMSMLVSIALGNSFSETNAQSSKTARSIESILTSADSLLKQSYCTIPPDTVRLNKLIKRLNKIEEEIKSYKMKVSKTAEAGFVAGIHLTKLERRRAAYQQAKQGKLDCDSLKTISRDTTASHERELSLCEQSLRSYLGDSSETAFGDIPNAQQILDQQAFLKQLIECLSLIVSEESSFKRADTLLTRLFVAKRITPELLKLLTSSQIKTLVESILKRPDREAVIRTIVEYLSRVNSPEANKLLQELVSSGDQAVINRILETILHEAARDQRKLVAFEELILNWPRHRRQELFIKPLLQLLHRTRDDDMLAIIFTELAKQIPDSTNQRIEKILRLIENDLFGGKKEIYAQAERLRALIEHATKLLDKSHKIKETLVAAPMYRVGNLSPDLKPAYVTAIKEQFREAFERASFEVSEDTNKQKPPFYVERNFEYDHEKRLIKLYLRFFDGTDNFLITGFDENVAFTNDLAIFQNSLSTTFTRVAQQLIETLSAYLHIEDLTGNPLPSLFDRDKLKNYLALGSYFDLELDSIFIDKNLWTKADAIYFEVFESEHDWIKASRLGEQLHTRIIEAYQRQVAPEYVQDNRTYLTIAGKQRGQSQRAYDIELGINRIRAMTITLNFRQLTSQQKLTDLQIESSARFIIQEIGNYLRVNYQQIEEGVEEWKKNNLPPIIDSLKKELNTPGISPAIAVSSLFVAGSPQFLIAHQKKVSWKNWRYVLGSALMAGQMAAVIGAVSNDNSAITAVNERDLANKKLEQRNACLYTAGATMAVSAVVALLDGLFSRPQSNQSTKNANDKTK